MYWLEVCSMRYTPLNKQAKSDFCSHFCSHFLSDYFGDKVIILRRSSRNRNPIYLVKFPFFNFLAEVSARKCRTRNFKVKTLSKNICALPRWCTACDTPTAKYWYSDGYILILRLVTLKKIMIFRPETKSSNQLKISYLHCFLAMFLFGFQLATKH